MKKYIVYKPYAEGVGTVQAIICNPRPEQLEDEGVYTEADVPTREDISSMDAYLRINLVSGELYYDYIARETFETKLSSLESENSELKQAIAELTMMIATVSQA